MDAKKNLVIDVVALIVYAIVANPSITGISLHEWLGLGVLVVFLVHTAVHVDWVVDTMRTALCSPSWARTGNLVVDVVAVIALMVCIVSGLLVSGAVLPTFGYYADGYYFWGPLHAFSAKALLALLLVHVVAHGKWIVHFFKRGRGNGDDGRTED